jgi:diadenosine tetraphosphate (Ap4A) HIT family hydrolase
MRLFPTQLLCYLHRMSACELCDTSGGELLWQDARCRVVRVGGVEGGAFPGFCRVVWRAHVREMSDLAPADRRHLLDVVSALEAAMRTVVRPDKINLASLGNVVPHLHWHVIPRWADDSHFPAPIWAAAVRPVPARTSPASADLAKALVLALEGQS